MFERVTEIMYFVPNRREAANWYAQLFDTPITTLENAEHFFLCLADQEIWFHQVDSKVSSGAAGQVAY